MVNCDAWFEAVGRKRWSNTHGRAVGHDLNDPPTHRKNSFMSWMCDRPDAMLEQDKCEMAKQKRQMHGGRDPTRIRQRRPRPVTAGPMRGSGLEHPEYISELHGVRQGLLHALEEVEAELEYHPSEVTHTPKSRPATAALGRGCSDFRPRSASKRPMSQQSSIKGYEAECIDRRLTSALKPAMTLMDRRKGKSVRQTK